MYEKNYYIVCPSNAVTGGPDALHQMCFYMTKLGLKCKIAYIADRVQGLNIPQPYRIYISDFCLLKEIKDSENNILIMPEIYAYLSLQFNKALTFIWWLSVDNNKRELNTIKKIYRLITAPVRVIYHPDFYHCSAISKTINSFKYKEYTFENERDNIIHLCASYYAYDFVTKQSSRPVFRCIEPISYIFLDRYKEDKKELDRNNTILYNPKKSGDIVERLRIKYPLFEFKPLINMTQSELISAYKQAKLYIDFGPFPGAERIPKEAVLYGCLIITGRHGASNYYGDVPIPDSYKFNEDTQLELIAQKMVYCLDNYEMCYGDFDEYRKTVLNLENNFIDSLKSIFLAAGGK